DAERGRVLAHEGRMALPPVGLELLARHLGPAPQAEDDLDHGSDSARNIRHVEGSAVKPSIAFVCAMPMELKPLAKKLALRKTALGGVDVRAGSLAGRDVVAIATGMGTQLATRATERLLDAVDVERVVVFGITGAVDNETPIGTLILPEVVVD